MVSEHARTIDRHAVRVFARAITPRRTAAIDRLEAVIYARATVYICIGYDTQMRAEMPPTGLLLDAEVPVAVSVASSGWTRFRRGRR